MSRTTVPEEHCDVKKRKRLTKSLHSLEVNGEVVLSPLLQQFLQQVVEPFRVVKAGVLGELLTVFIWHLEKKRIILKPPHSHPDIHLIPPTLVLRPTRSLCCWTEAGLVSAEHTGAVKIPPDTEHFRKEILFFSYRVMSDLAAGFLTCNFPENRR